MNLPIPEAQDDDAHGGKLVITSGIVAANCGLPVLTAIEFDCQ